MINSLVVKRLWIARYRVDFRLGHDGLLAQAYRMGLDPLNGDAILFVGRDRKRFKIIYTDSTGLWLSYKRFHKGAIKTNFQFLENLRREEITAADLAMLLEGASYFVAKRVEEWPSRT